MCFIKFVRYPDRLVVWLNIKDMVIFFVNKQDKKGSIIKISTGLELKVFETPSEIHRRLETITNE